MKVRLVSREKKIKRVAGPRVLAKMRGVAAIVRDSMKEDVGTPFPPASRPNQFPHKRKGVFQRSIRYRTDKIKRRVILYSDDIKAIWLEYGTRFMEPRPTFRKAARKYRDQLDKAFKSGVSLEVK